MRRTTLGRAVLLASLFAPAAHAQQPTSGGTITGVVRDGASRPVAGADVVARPGDHRTRTDSVGRFMITGLGPDNYSVRARKLGYSPEDWDVKLAKSGTVDITIMLEVRPAFLDTVTVRADADCPEVTTIEAFLCRRHRPGGKYIDYNEIDDLDVMYAAEVLRDVPGLRVDFRNGTFGPVYYVHTDKPSGCINSLVDGKLVTGANPIPELTRNLVALEIYTHPDSIPPQLQRYVWPRGELSRSGRCTVIVYWTNRGLGKWTKSGH